MKSEIYLRLRELTPANSEKKYVPAYLFDIYLYKTNTKIGTCDLRAGYNENTYYGGNIGYEIDPQYRGHNYATKACLLLIELAKSSQMPYLIITCKPNNIASRKTCEKLGAKLVQEIAIPKEHELYHEDQPYECQYKLELKK